MRKRIVPWGIVVVLLWALSPTLHAQFEHPDLKANKIAIHNVLVLPPQASVVKTGMMAGE